MGTFQELIIMGIFVFSRYSYKFHKTLYTSSCIKARCCFSEVKTVFCTMKWLLHHSVERCIAWCSVGVAQRDSMCVGCGGAPGELSSPARDRCG